MCAVIHACRKAKNAPLSEAESQAYLIGLDGERFALMFMGSSMQTRSPTW